MKKRCLAALLLIASTAQADDIPVLSMAKDLLLPCQEADNDPRDGYLALLECTQFIRGFLVGMEISSDGASVFCLPDDANRDDKVRRAFVSWVHASFTARSKLPVGTGLSRALQERFPCK